MNHCIYFKYKKCDTAGQERDLMTGNVGKGYGNMVQGLVKKKDRNKAAVKRSQSDPVGLGSVPVG